MLWTPAVGSHLVFEKCEGVSMRHRELRSFASTQSLVTWIGDHDKNAEVDGNSVIATVHVLDEDWIGPVRLDLTTQGCYPVRRCLFEFAKFDIGSLYYRGGPTFRLGYYLTRSSSLRSVRRFIAAGLAAADPGWRLECWTPVVTAGHRVLTVRN